MKMKNLIIGCGLVVFLALGQWSYNLQQQKIEYFDRWLEKLDVYSKTDLLRYRILDDSDVYDREYKISDSKKVALSDVKIVSIQYNRHRKNLTIITELFDKAQVANMSCEDIPKNIQREICADLKYLIIDTLSIKFKGSDYKIQDKFIDSMEFIFSSGELGDPRPQGGVIYTKDTHGDIAFNKNFILK